MIRMKLFAVALLSCAAFTSFAAPQSLAQDASTRIDLLEEQIRLLTGKVEELNFTVKQLQGQVRKQGTAAPAAVVAAPKKKVAAVVTTDDQIASEPLQQEAAVPLKKLVTPKAGGEESIYGDAQLAEEDLGLAPAPQSMTAGKNAASASEDAGFQGQVLTPDVDEQQVAAVPQVVVDGAVDDPASAGGVEPVSLQPDTAESLYKRSDEALIQRRFPEAEQGFRTFLEKYPDHSLSGSAQYWLGETFYTQGDYRTAAQNFLTGYQKFPKSRRAPDSLLKLGLALNKLGQKSQACAALGSVASEFPKAVEAKRRAQTEFKRVGC